MAIKTISELKALWVGGYAPNQSDYVDLFDTFDSLGDNDPTVYVYKVGALPEPSIDPHFHLAYLKLSHVKSLVVDGVDSVTISSDTVEGHSHDIEIQYNLSSNKFIVINITSLTDHLHTADIVGFGEDVEPIIRKSTQTFTLNTFDDTPIELIPAPGQDKAIFVDKVFISLKNYDGFNPTSLFSELKVGQLLFNTLEIFLEFGADQREHFITQGAQTQIVRKSHVNNQPFNWTVNPSSEAGFEFVNVEFTITVYYTVEDILDSNNLPS